MAHLSRNSSEIPPHLDGGEAPKLCDFPGCDEAGEHRAPRAPNDLRSYRWFCLDHVREYNRAWNFFEGWSQGEIEQFQRDDITGHRPTWPLGTDPSKASGVFDEVLRRFKSEWLGETDDHRGRTEQRNGVSDEQHRALALLNLEAPFSRAELKQRYKALVKRHHPDANGGSRDSEELLKQINQAYNYLLKVLS